MKKKNKIIINDNSYNLGKKISYLSKKNKNLIVISLKSTLKDYLSLKKINKNYYSLFLNRSIIPRNSNKIELIFFRKLVSEFNNILKISFNYNLNKHITESFSKNIYTKINNFLDEDNIINFYLSKLKNIKLLCSQHSLGSGSSIYNYSKLSKINSLCFSHGTYSYTTNKYANQEWAVHSQTMVNRNYKYIASHSQMMTQFINKVQINNKKPKILKMKPFLFSTNQDQPTLSNTDFLKELGLTNKKKIVLHANTPKFGRTLIYETVDEYVNNVNQLIELSNKYSFLLLISKLIKYV